MGALLFASVAAALASAPPCAGAATVRGSPELAPLIERAADSRVVVLGEHHRTRAAPALLGELLAPLHERGYSVLAIEGQEDRQVYVDMFLAGTKDASILRDAYLTPELADVVVRARELSRAAPSRRAWRVLLVDGPSAWNVSTLEQSRDQRMFGHVRRVLDEDAAVRVVLYVGNTHTSEGVRLKDLAEGPGHEPDAIPIGVDPVAALLELYTRGKSLSVRTVGPGDALGKAVRARSPALSREVIVVDGSAIAGSSLCVDPGGSFNETLRTTPLGVFTDVVVVFAELGETRGWPAR